MTPERGDAVVLADLKLIQGVLDGSRDDLDAFIERMRCIPRIQGARNRRLGRPLTPEDLADLAQETFVVIWKKLGTFRGEAPLEAWVHRFCVLTLMNSVRRASYRHTDELFDVHRDESPDPTERLDDEVLIEALEGLPEDEAVVLRLKHFEDLAFPEIGRRLEISPNTAKTRYYRGLDRLRTRLQPAFEPTRLRHA